MKNKIHNKILIPGLFGNILEWYDFALYGYFSSKISSLFFPSDDKLISTLITYGIFAIGLFMRPVGGIIFGYLGDKYGRKKALSYAIFMMAIPTCIIGILPSHEKIGIYAGIILTACRFFQGIAIGGEFTGSIVYIIEHAPQNKRGFYGSCIMFSAFSGILLGSFTGALTNFLSINTFAADWAWRIPFISGLFLGIVGLYFRTKMPETPEFNKLIYHGNMEKSPLKKVFFTAPKRILQATGLVMLPAMSFYLIFVYLATYLEMYLDVSLSTSLFINSISMIIMTITIPVFGILSDKYGRKPLLMLGTIGFLLLSYPLFVLISTGKLVLILLAQCCFAFLVALVYSSIPATLFEMFETDIRFTSISLPYNLANSLFGGTAPFVATILIYYTNILGPSFYLITMSIIAIPLIYKLKETNKVNYVKA